MFIVVLLFWGPWTYSIYLSSLEASCYRTVKYYRACKIALRNPRGLLFCSVSYPSTDELLGCLATTVRPVLPWLLLRVSQWHATVPVGKSEVIKSLSGSLPTVLRARLCIFVGGDANVVGSCCDQGGAAAFTMCRLSYIIDRMADGDLELPVILVLNIGMRNGITRARAFLAGSSRVL